VSRFFLVIISTGQSESTGIQMAILFVSGVNDLSTVGVRLDGNGKFGYLMDGNCSVHGKLPLKKGIAADLVLFGKGVRQRSVNFATNPSLIFNQIADADTHRGALERCVELCAQVPSRVINRPDRIMQTTRDRISELLQGVPGVIMPRTVRFQPTSPEDVYERAASEKVDYPFIVRVAGDHAGKSMVLVNGEADYKSMHIFPFDGRDFYLTEYVDYKDEAGLYHKQRIVVVDGEPVLRHSLFNSDWKIHGSSRLFMLERETWEDDRARTHQMDTELIPKLGPAIREISNRLELEYFGVDCNVRPNGEMLIFEVNANMNILFNQYPEMKDRMNMIHARIHTLLARHSGEQVI
jgi:glutathione synthase/RimK-type ligase-like ATP-grasp enzyme